MSVDEEYYNYQIAIFLSGSFAHFFLIGAWWLLLLKGSLFLVRRDIRPAICCWVSEEGPGGTCCWCAPLVAAAATVPARSWLLALSSSWRDWDCVVCLTWYFTLVTLYDVGTMPWDEEGLLFRVGASFKSSVTVWEVALTIGDGLSRCCCWLGPPMSEGL